MTTQTYVATLRVMECGHSGCGVVFALSEDYAQRRERDHVSFYCPNGHSRYYPQKTDVDLAREEARNAAQRAQQLRNLLEDERDQHHRTERRLTATRGVVTRTKRRIAKGLCPRCHEHFGNVEAHIATEHPDYAGEAAAIVVAEPTGK